MIDSNMVFEVKAEAFRRMTGYMAPGKDAGSRPDMASYEERSAAWESWNQANKDCVIAIIAAMQSVLGLNLVCLSMEEPCQRTR